MQRTKHSLLLFVAVFFALLLASVPLAGQAISGDLVGTITDPTGAAVPNAKVDAVNAATGLTSSTTTNTSGEYRLSNLPAGIYNVTITATSFATGTLRNVRVNLNQIATANMTLQLGQTSATVDVIEAPAVIDTTTAQVQNTFEVKQLEDLPIAATGSGVLNLSLLSSGVASAGGVGVGSGPSVGGQRPRNNNFTVEGIDNNSKAVTGPLLYLPNDSVAEFTLLQNQFSPEYGHSSGGQFNTIIKSGTNELHGRIYEYNQNRNYNAMDQADKRQGLTSVPRYDQNRLGANIGGPIIKNKWFYFGNFEYNPLGRSPSPSGLTFAPTAEGYSVLGGISSLNQTNLSVLKQYLPAAPTASDTITVAGQTVPVGVLPLSLPNWQNGYYGVGTMDYNISERDQLRGRFAYNKYNFIDTNAQLPAFFTTVPTTNYLATLAEYHSFSPTVTNEFRLGFNRQNQLWDAGNFQFGNYPAGMFPQIDLDDLNLFLGPDPNAPQGGIQNLYQGTDNLTWVKGNHTFKFGTDFRKSISPQQFTQRARGEYEYVNTETFLLDLAPDWGERSAGNPVYYGDQIMSYNYAQDQWKIKPNLTLNLGLRYEYTTVPFTMRQQTLNSIASVPGVLEFNEPQPQKNNWAPRIGIAYSPGSSGNTSIRAGFGIAYDVLFDNLGLLALPPQLSTTQDVNTTGLPQTGDPNFLANGGLTGGAAGAQMTAEEARANTANYVGSTWKQPYSVQWNFGIQHVFRQNYTFEARYLGTRGVHLPVQAHPNNVAPVDAQHYLPTYMSTPDAGALSALPYTLGDLSARSIILPSFEQAGFIYPITEFAPQGYSRYHGLALQLTRRFASGLQFVGAYTWSHLIDNSTAEVFSTVLTPRRPQDFLNLAADQSDSALDRRHRFTLSVIYDVPWFKSGNWFARNVVGNWELAPIYTFESPEYYTVQSGIDSNLNTDSWPDRTIVNPSGVAHTGSDVTPIDRNGNVVALGDDATVAYVAQNPNARYIRAGYGALANAGRNTEPTAHINNWDLTAMKRFNMTERFRVELAAQVFNVFNHPQYVPGFISDIQPTTDSTTSGVQSFVRLNQANMTRGLWNTPSNVFSSSPRSMQLFLKFIF